MVGMNQRVVQNLREDLMKLRRGFGSDGAIRVKSMDLMKKHHVVQKRYGMISEVCKNV